MIDIVKSETPATPEIGDYLSGADYMIPKPVELLKTCNLIHVGNFARNPFTALVHAGISKNSVGSFRHDVLNKSDLYRADTSFYGVIPEVLLTNRTHHYNVDDVLWSDMVKDVSWSRGVTFRSFLEGDEKAGDTPVTRAYMGSGYTEVTRPSDGSNSLEWCYIGLNNGDAVRCVAWEWYNK